MTKKEIAARQKYTHRPKLMQMGVVSTGRVVPGDIASFGATGRSRREAIFTANRARKQLLCKAAAAACRSPRWPWALAILRWFAAL